MPQDGRAGLLQTMAQFLPYYLEEGGIPHAYVRGPFGEHGFQLKGGWTPGCIEWLHSRGFGRDLTPADSH